MNEVKGRMVTTEAQVIRDNVGAVACSEGALQLVPK